MLPDNSHPNMSSLLIETSYPSGSLERYQQRCIGVFVLRLGLGLGLGVWGLGLGLGLGLGYVCRV